MTDVIIRPATAEDRPFIADSWLRSFRRSPWAVSVWGQPDSYRGADGRWVVGVRDRVYYSRYGHEGFVDDVLDGGIMRNPSLGYATPPWGSVAHAPDDPAFIIGFSVYGHDRQGKPLLHYLYVRQDYRRGGFGLELLGGAAPRVVTAETPKWQAFAKKHGIAYEYTHPYGRNER